MFVSIARRRCRRFGAAAGSTSKFHQGDGFDGIQNFTLKDSSVIHQTYSQSTYWNVILVGKKGENIWCHEFAKYHNENPLCGPYKAASYLTKFGVGGMIFPNFAWQSTLSILELYCTITCTCWLKNDYHGQIGQLWSKLHSLYIPRWELLVGACSFDVAVLCLHTDITICLAISQFVASDVFFIHQTDYCQLYLYMCFLGANIQGIVMKNHNPFSAMNGFVYAKFCWWYERVNRLLDNELIYFNLTFKHSGNRIGWNIVMGKYPETIWFLVGSEPATLAWHQFA